MKESRKIHSSYELLFSNYHDLFLKLAILLLADMLKIPETNP